MFHGRGGAPGALAVGRAKKPPLSPCVRRFGGHWGAQSSMRAANKRNQGVARAGGLMTRPVGNVARSGYRAATRAPQATRPSIPRDTYWGRVSLITSCMQQFGGLSPRRPAVKAATAREAGPRRLDHGLQRRARCTQAVHHGTALLPPLPFPLWLSCLERAVHWNGVRVPCAAVGFGERAIGSTRVLTQCPVAGYRMCLLLHQMRRGPNVRLTHLPTIPGTAAWRQHCCQPRRSRPPPSITWWHS